MELTDILKNRVLRYPQGAGGSWFLNLIYVLVNHSKYNKFDYTNSVNFHCSSDDSVNTHEITNSNDIILSDCSGFNFYLNFWWKKRIFENYNNFNNTSDYDKIQSLSQEARWILYSTDYKLAYLENISIKWGWLYNDIDQFVNSVESIIQQKLNQRQIEILLEQIKLYKQTNISPVFHFHNYTSIPWLAWGLTILNEKQIDLDFEFVDSKQIPLLAKNLLRHDSLLADETVPRMLMI